MSEKITRYRPLRNNVLVKVLKSEPKVSESGIIIDQYVRVFKDNGTVVYLSDSVRKRGKLLEGDKVFFGTFSGVNVEYNKEQFILLSENEVLGKFEDLEQVEVIKSHQMDGLIDLIQRDVDRRTDDSVRNT